MRVRACAKENTAHDTRRLPLEEDGQRCLLWKAAVVQTCLVRWRDTRSVDRANKELGFGTAPSCCIIIAAIGAFHLAAHRGRHCLPDVAQIAAPELFLSMAVEASSPGFS
ncbi:unnamed protein product [Nezara viridula]|uniref:Uncharacterized protein n=1 Tax=Nezara viridula TaxID=85310 RepID=A0A9P0HF44_NEZVI|nr:unnamed protein product [Nezara viridula]